MHSLYLSAKYAVGKAAIVWRKLFNEHLLITNIVVSTVMGGTGDVIAQHYEKFTKKHEEAQDSEDRSLETNRRRMFHMSACGMTTGIVSHYWYIILDKWLPGRSVRIVMKKVLADQLIYSPLCLGTFFATLAVLRGTEGHSFKDEIIYKGSTIYTVECLVWPPLQAFNYSFLAKKYRVMFDNAISFGFCVFVPYVVHKDDDENVVK